MRFFNRGLHFPVLFPDYFFIDLFADAALVFGFEAGLFGLPVPPIACDDVHSASLSAGKTS
ncbi:MAG: hypothetical protein AAGD47_12605, partial [Pseudomonadota bacterium]